jgi:hypothetical protein
VPELLARTLEACVPMALELGGERALQGLDDLLDRPSPSRQRIAALGPDGLSGLVQSLVEQF